MLKFFFDFHAFLYLPKAISVMLSYPPFLISLTKKNKPNQPTKQTNEQNQMKWITSHFSATVFYILYSTFILLPKYKSRWSHFSAYVCLNGKDQIQTVHYYKYKRKLDRQNVITQAGVLLNTGVHKIICF